VVEYKVAVKAVLSRFKATKNSTSIIQYRLIDAKSCPEPFSEYKRCIGKDFQPFNALGVDILTYGGAGRGLAEGQTDKQSHRGLPTKSVGRSFLIWRKRTLKLLSLWIFW